MESDHFDEQLNEGTLLVKDPKGADKDCCTLLKLLLKSCFAFSGFLSALCNRLARGPGVLIAGVAALFRGELKTENEVLSKAMN